MKFVLISMFFHALIVLFGEGKDLYPIKINSCQSKGLKDLTCPRKFLHENKAVEEGVPSFVIKIVIKSPKLKIKGKVCTGLYHVTSCQRSVLWTDYVSHWIETRDLEKYECDNNREKADETLYPDPQCEWSAYKEVRQSVLSIKDHTFYVNLHSGLIEDEFLVGSCGEDNCQVDGKHHQVLLDFPKQDFDQLTIESVGYVYKESQEKVWLISDLIGKTDIKKLKQSTFLNRHVYLTEENYLIECKECLRYTGEHSEIEIPSISHPDLLNSHLISEESKIWEKLCELTLPVIHMTKNLTQSQLDFFRPRIPGVSNLIIVNRNVDDLEDDILICLSKWDYADELDKSVEKEISKLSHSLVFYTNLGSFIDSRLSNSENGVKWVNLIYDENKKETVKTEYRKYKVENLMKSKKLIKIETVAKSLKTGFLGFINSPLTYITGKIQWVFISLFALGFLILSYQFILRSNQYKRVNTENIKCHI